MSSDNKPQPERRSAESATPGERNLAMQSAMAMELPFTFAAAVALGGLLGYYLDKWLHTAPWLLILFGVFGFVAGIVEIARRFRPSGSTSGDGNSSS